jgi:hypothetical protein
VFACSGYVLFRCIRPSARLSLLRVATSYQLFLYYLFDNCWSFTADDTQVDAELAVMWCKRRRVEGVRDEGEL